MPPAAPSYFPKFYWWYDISSLSKVILVLGKTRSHRKPNLGYGGLGGLGDSMFCQKNSAWDIIHKQACCHDKAANHLLPIAAAFRIIWITSMEECLRLMKNLIQSHMLTQWRLLPTLTSTVKLSLLMHVHSSPISSAATLHRCCTNHSRYINNGLIFPERPCICLKNN